MVYVTLCVAPWKASSAETSMVVLRSPPFAGRLDRAPPFPPLKMDEKSKPLKPLPEPPMLLKICDQSTSPPV